MLTVDAAAVSLLLWQKKYKKTMGPEVIKYLLLKARLLSLPLSLIKKREMINIQHKAFCSDD